MLLSSKLHISKNNHLARTVRTLISIENQHFSGRAPDSNFDLTLDFDLGPILDLDPGDGSSLDEDVANSSGIKIKFGLYYSGIVQLFMSGRLFRIFSG
ncbi:hypothetical protein EVAR_95674_1 [Eumeta japonica]|uniref:Uncharacterized protein n=1 Tax=Eumeta variegata TaxID=151549 RepID=A0A4C1VM28_EUMVA|nr:hypothetical protein EVAR_95674_1 [Eumeta japonica]